MNELKKITNYLRLNKEEKKEIKFLNKIIGEYFRYTNRKLSPNPTNYYIITSLKILVNLKELFLNSEINCDLIGKTLLFLKQIETPYQNKICATISPNREKYLSEFIKKTQYNQYSIICVKSILPNPQNYNFLSLFEIVDNFSLEQKVIKYLTNLSPISPNSDVNVSERNLYNYFLGFFCFSPPIFLSAIVSLNLPLPNPYLLFIYPIAIVINLIHDFAS